MSEIKQIIKSEENYVDVIGEIKKEIKNTQIKTMREVNSNLIMMYFRIGKILDENSFYGSGFIKNISHAIRLEYPNADGYSERNLKRMKRFYNEYKDCGEKVPQVVALLPWGHNMLLIEKIKDMDIRMIYALVNNTLKDPYIFDFISLENNYKEKDLEKKMITKIKDVLLEFGSGFSFVGNQYKITVGNMDYYLDLLFYHLKLKSYIVVELKVTEFIPEYIGKMNFYLSVVDNILKDKNDNPTIGLILCKDNNRITARYSLEGVNKPIGITTYELSKYLPSEEDINNYLDMK